MKNPQAPHHIGITLEKVSMFDETNLGVSVLRDANINSLISALVEEINSKIRLIEKQENK